MKIVHLGNFRHPWCTETHLARSFVALGHTVVAVQEDEANAHLVSGLIDEHRPRLFLQTRTWSWPSTEWVLPVMDRCADLGVVTAGYHLDRMFGLGREDRVTREPMFRSDVVFTADGDADDAYRSRGVKHRWLRAGVVEDEARRVPANPRLYGGKLVAFVGTEHYHPEWPHRAALVAHLRERWGDRFLKVGDGNPTIRGLELNELYASVPVVVGDSCFATSATRYWSDRPYETWGRGGCLVFPRVDALAGELGEYPSFDVGDFDGLDRIVDELLDDGPARDRHVADLHHRVRSVATYRHRCAEMLRALGLGE